MSDVTTYRLRWEMVSAIRHPEFYIGERFAVDPATVPGECWHEVVRESTEAGSIHDQLDGLRRLVASGEAIRNIRCESAVAAPLEFTEVDW